MSLNTIKTYRVDGLLEDLCLNCATVVSNNHDIKLTGDCLSTQPRCERCIPAPPRNRKPYKEIRVCDNTGKSNRTNPNFCVRIYSNGVLCIREKRRREFVELTIATLYERALWAAAMKSLREKQKSRRKPRRVQRKG